MNKRINFIAVVAIITSIVLLIDIYHMQHIAFDKYNQLAQKNRIVSKPILAQRGIIFDRNHIVLAENRPSLNIYITPKSCDNTLQALDFVSSFTEVTPWQKQKFIKQKSYSFDSVIIKQDISDEEATLIYSHLPAMPCVSVHEGTLRQYHLSPAVSNVVGYLGANGVETTFNSIISGKDGHYDYEVNAARTPIQIIKKVEPKKGYDIELTIDAKLQEYAYNAFGDEQGAAVVINPENGEILALVSHPSFDNNLFLKKIASEDYNKIINDPNLPLLDRASKGLFAPGSTIKPFIAASALQAGYINKSFSIMDQHGYFMPKGTKHIYRDWLRTGGHGLVDIETSLAYSCDVFYYKLSMLIGMKKILPWLSGFGFGSQNIKDIPYAVSGILSSPTWKKSHVKAPWYTGDTVMSYIGQGYMLVTPLQLAHALTILVNAGKDIEPHILRTVLANKMQLKPQVKITEPLNLEKAKLSIIIRGMERVIREKSNWATGWRFGRPSYSVAGKTGTSQVVHDNRKTRQQTWSKNLRDNSWFMAFSPVDRPKFAVVVITEHSSAASKIARKILDFVN